MGRTARVVVPGVPHHIVQRGNRGQTTFFSARDYALYLEIAVQTFADAEVQVWAYCLMPNHVHLIATPAEPEALAQAVGATHVRYTRAINRREGWSGYLWQGRFASFPMDDDYFLQCARYIGLNPVRAGLAPRATDWPWSSVRGHLGRRADPLLTKAPLAERLGAHMSQFFDLDVADEARRVLRRASVTGRPLGAAAWVKAVDRSATAGTTPRTRTPFPQFAGG